MELRPVVLRFAQLMEARLREHDAERGCAGWLDYDMDYLIHRMIGEVDEVTCLWRDRWPPPSLAEMAAECADVANYAMMIADLAGTLLEDVPAPEV